MCIKGRQFDFTTKPFSDGYDDDAHEDDLKKHPGKSGESSSTMVHPQVEPESELTLCRLMIALHELIDIPPLVAPHVVSVRIS